MKLTSEPGMIVSGIAHAALLVAVLVAFAGAKKFVDAQEATPVEIVTEAEFNAITKGDKAAKEAKPVPQKAEKIAALPMPKPTPPLAMPEARDDTPLPPPPLRRTPEPVAEDAVVPNPAVAKPAPPKPAPQKVEAGKPDPVRIVQPPPRPHSAPVPVAEVPKPLPPARPEPVKAAPAKVEAKVEPPPNPDDAEVVVPKPRPPPKAEPQKPVAAVVPPPVEPVVPPKKVRPTARPSVVAAAAPPKQDEIAKQLEQKPAPVPTAVPVPKAPPEPVAPKVAAAVPPAPVAPAPAQHAYDPDSIAKLLSRDKPQQSAAAAPEVSRTGSIGSPTQNAAKMSPTQTAALDGLMMDQYNRCWPDNGMDAQGYVPQIRVQYGPDGALLGPPVLVNPPANPALHSLAEDALRAVRKCNPLKIPAQYAPFYDEWRQRRLHFDPANRNG